MIQAPPPPPAIIERVGQGPTADLARLRGIKEVLLPLQVSVDAFYLETSNGRKTSATEAILVQVNANGIPGVEVAREYHKGNLYYAEVRFDLSKAQSLAMQKVNTDLDELDWLLHRPRSGGRTRGLQRLWAQVQQDLAVCKLLSCPAVRTPDRKVVEEFCGPRLISVDDGQWDRSTDLSQRDLASRICQLFGSPDGTRTVSVKVATRTTTTMRAHDALHCVRVQIAFNGTTHLITEEIVTPRHSHPTPSQILGAIGPQLEELISSL